MHTKEMDMSNNKRDAAFHGTDDHNPAYADINGPYDRNADPASGLADKPKKRKRVFMWTFLVINLLFLVWVITGIAGNASTPADTGGVLTQADANAARDAGTAIGVGLLLAFWAFVDFILFVVWAVVRLSRRGA
jgi:hypothetical protein